MQEEHSRILTQGALEFLAELVSHFDSGVEEVGKASPLS